MQKKHYLEDALSIRWLQWWIFLLWFREGNRMKLEYDRLHHRWSGLCSSLFIVRVIVQKSILYLHMEVNLKSEWHVICFLYVISRLATRVFPTPIWQVTNHWNFRFFTPNAKFAKLLCLFSTGNENKIACSSATLAPVRFGLFLFWAKDGRRRSCWKFGSLKRVISVTSLRQGI